jgi:hypothetical protein
MATPSLAMIPSGYKASKVYSVLPESGVGDFDFTRATTATRINSSGLIEEMAINVPRLEYPLIDGVVNGCPSLLLEPQSTNLIPYSEEFDNAAWSKFRSSISPNTSISLDGTLNADKLIDTSVSGTHGMEDTISSISSGSKYTYSIFAKADEIKQVGLLLATQGRIFDLENGTILDEFIAAPDASKIEDYGNGWYRCSITITLNATSVKTSIYLSKNNNITFTGDGTSGVYLWGAQLEEQSYPTSYIPTNGTAVTRAAETATGSGDASTFSDSEGVLMAEISALVNNGESRRISISHSAADTSNRVTLEVDETTSTIKAFMSSGNVTVGSITVNNINQTNNNKIALLYKENTFEMHINGFLLGSDYTIASLPIELSRLQLEGANGSNDFYGKTKQLQYYNSALTDSELETLTSWTSFSDMANGQQYSII